MTQIKDAQTWAKEPPSEAVAHSNVDLRPGSVLGGRYEILQSLGEGGMGAVFKARDNEVDRIVALKTIRPELAGSADVLHRFRQELVLARQITDRNVVRIYDLGVADGVRFISMEYIEGQELQEVLHSRGKLPPKEAAGIMLQVCYGLSAAHAAGVVHRDLKPQNIMIDKQGRVAVMDFGIAHSIEVSAAMAKDAAAGDDAAAHLTQMGALLGTPRYMSPEQARCAKVDHRSDLFTAGLILYELTLGDLPPARPKLLEMLQDRGAKQIPPPIEADPQIPRPLNNIIARCLQLDTTKRYQSADELARDLEIWLGVRKRHRTNRALIFAMVALSLVLVGTLFLLGRRAMPWRRGASLRQFTTTLEENRVIAGAISPNGRRLVYAERDGPLVLRDIQGAKVREITLPKGLAATEIAWFPSGLELLLGVESTAARIPSLWRVSLAGDDPRLLRDYARMGIPSPDGHKIAFTTSDQSEVLIMDSNGQHARRLLAGGRVDSFPLLIWSADGRRLSYQRRHYLPRGSRPQLQESENNYERSYESVSIESGKQLAAQPNIRMRAGCETSGGRLLFLRPDNLTNPFQLNVWEVAVDAKTGAFTGAPRRLTNLKDAYMSSMSCSPDGKVAAVQVQVGLSNIYIGDLQPSGVRLGAVRRLTFNQKPQYPHAWTADGQAVIFELGNGLDGWDLYIQRLNERVALPLATGPLSRIMPQLSPDGNWVLYCFYDVTDPQGRSRQKMMRVPVDGGTPVEVPVSPGFDEFRCALTPHKRCVLRTIESGQFVYSELDPFRGRGRELARTAWSEGVLGDWGLSSDGLQVATPNHDAREARIQVLSLDLPAGQAEAHDIEVPGLSRLRGVTWAADDRGWFASLDTAKGVEIDYIALSGHSVVARGPFHDLGPSVSGRSPSRIC